MAQFGLPVRLKTEMQRTDPHLGKNIDTIQMYGERNRKAKAQSQPQLLRDSKNNMGFYRYAG